MSEVLEGDLLHVKNLIAGEFLTCRHLLDSVEPSTGQVWARIPSSSHWEVDAAVNAAKRAFKTWSELSYAQRGVYLLKVADLLETRLEEFAVAESRDQGKPVWLARTMDIPRAVHNLRHFSRTLPHQLNTSSLQQETGSLNYTVREPLGVAALISPWNLPLYLLTFKMAPALMCGNTVVAKPSELTSVTAYMLAKLFQEAGIPSGVLNIVFGTGPIAGEALVAHPGVALISFTGSSITGKHIAQVAAPMFKKLSLEMGGKNAAIIFKDCDLDKCIQTLLRSCFINQGQVCLCTSRVFVERSLYDTFVTKFVDAAKDLKVGSPNDDTVFLSALNSEAHLQKVRQYVQYAIEDGGKVHCGEGVDILNLPEKNKNGYYMLPTIITDLGDESRCMQEEIFGPVTCIVSFEEEKEVLKRANKTPYGLCASIWTSNLARAHRVAHSLKVGTVWTNCWLVRDLDMPFGGMKASGMGREGTHHSLEFYTEVKTICTKFK